MSDNSSDYIKTMMEKKHVEFIPLELTEVVHMKTALSL